MARFSSFLSDLHPKPSGKPSEAKPTLRACQVCSSLAFATNSASETYIAMYKGDADIAEGHS